MCQFEHFLFNDLSRSRDRAVSCMVFVEDGKEAIKAEASYRVAATLRAYGLSPVVGGPEFPFYWELRQKRRDFLQPSRLGI
jgi:hypothetical protein